MRLVLVRHGQTAWNQSRRIQGCRSDVELGQTGKEQAERVALSLASRRIDAVYSSPLRRAMDTALAIAQACKLEVQVAPGLKEIDAGELEGLCVDEMGEEHGGFGGSGEKATYPPPYPVESPWRRFRVGPGLRLSTWWRNTQVVKWPSSATSSPIWL